MWSPVEKTALAEAEVEYHDHQSHAIWVKFPCGRRLPRRWRPATDFNDARKGNVVIWTTTPWTIPQNRAICFGPEISYGLYEVTGRPEECWARIGDRYLWPTPGRGCAWAHAAGAVMYRRLRDVTRTSWPR
jgi:isoleucyl-tRNA synthetase